MSRFPSNHRSGTKKDDNPVFGQHKRGTNTKASQNSLANIIKQNEIKNKNIHDKENFYDNNRDFSCGKPSIVQHERVKQKKEDRALHAVNENLSNLRLKNEPSSYSKTYPKSEEAENMSMSKLNNENSSVVNGSCEKLQIDEEPGTFEPIDGNKGLENTTEAENSRQEGSKHPLQHSWSFWYFKNDKTRDWKDNLIKIHDVHSVEDFWGVYMYLKDVSKINAGCDYALFKTGIMPTWEDKENESGGKWLIQFDPRDRKRCLDYYWREVLMYLIGNEAENDIINGAVVNVRPKHDKISLWLSTSRRLDEGHILSIGKQVKNRLHLTDMAIDFEIHKDSQAKKSSMSKFAYTL